MNKKELVAAVAAKAEMTQASVEKALKAVVEVTVAEVAKLFRQYQVFEYIRDCFGIFHAEGDEAVWEDLIPYLRNRGCHYA